MNKEPLNQQEFNEDIYIKKFYSIFIECVLPILLTLVLLFFIFKFFMFSITFLIAPLDETYISGIVCEKELEFNLLSQHRYSIEISLSEDEKIKFYGMFFYDMYDIGDEILLKKKEKHLWFYSISPTYSIVEQIKCLDV